MTDRGREREGGRVVLLLLLALALMAGGGYTAAYAGAGDKVPRGTTVAGVDIGGRTRDQAIATLEEGLSVRATGHYEVRAAGETRRFRAPEAGLGVDYAASVDAAGGERSWDPARLWDYYTDGDDLPAAVDVDESAMTAFLDRLASDLGTPAREGAVEFKGTRLRVTDPRPGETIDPDAARAAVEGAYLAQGEDAVARLPLVPVEPDIDGGDVRRAVEEFANPALSAPVTLRFGKAEVRLLPRDYAGTLRLDAEDGELVPGLDRKALVRLVRSRTGAHGTPVDATVQIRDGKPKVIPARPGVRYRPADLEKTLLDLVTRPEGKRLQSVPARSTSPDFTTRDARALKITERVSTFSTSYPHVRYRNVNLGRAAELVDGTLLEPGEVFSLNRIVGGGVSQLATTLFNAMFFAGLEDVEHQPHSFYIDRYPVGRDATVAWGSVDLRFRNDSPYGVLVKAHVTPSTPSRSGEVTVDMWSTRRWDITTTVSDRYDRTAARTRRVDSKRCHPNQGYGGFDIDVWRHFHEPGSDEVKRTEKFHTTYLPRDTVVCTHPDSEAS